MMDIKNGVCEECFETEETAVHGDISHIHLTEHDVTCSKCGRVCKCVDDWYFFGCTPGTQWLKKNDKGWREFRK